MTDRALTVDDLEHWALAGAHRQVIELTADRAVVDLCTRAGEPVERITSDRTELLEYPQQARSDLDVT